MDGADVWMVSRGGGLRFADEALLDVIVVTPLGRQELQRDLAAKLRISCFVDDAHAAASELGSNLVMGDSFADQWVSGRLVGHERETVTL